MVYLSEKLNFCTKIEGTFQNSSLCSLRSAHRTSWGIIKSFLLPHLPHFLDTIIFNLSEWQQGEELRYTNSICSESTHIWPQSRCFFPSTQMCIGVVTKVVFLFSHDKCSHIKKKQHPEKDGCLLVSHVNGNLCWCKYI